VWKAAYEREGTAGLVNKKPCAHAHPKVTAAAIVDHILHLRRTYHLGPIRIAWYLERYQTPAVSEIGYARRASSVESPSPVSSWCPVASVRHGRPRCRGCE
jgi:hypothetical protein